MVDKSLGVGSLRSYTGPVTSDTMKALPPITVHRAMSDAWWWLPRRRLSHVVIQPSKDSLGNMRKRRLLESENDVWQFFAFYTSTHPPATFLHFLKNIGNRYFSKRYHSNFCGPSLPGISYYAMSDSIKEITYLSNISYVCFSAQVIRVLIISFRTF